MSQWLVIAGRITTELLNVGPAGLASALSLSSSPGVLLIILTVTGHTCTMGPLRSLLEPQAPSPSLCLLTLTLPLDCSSNITSSKIRFLASVSLCVFVLLAHSGPPL